MAKWLPFITGAIKDGAQKLMSVFTRAKTDTESSSTGEPKAVADSMAAQPDLTAPLPNTYPYTGQQEGTASPSNTPLGQPGATEPSQLPNREITAESSIPQYGEMGKQEAPTPIPSASLQPSSAPSSLPNLPEWPKAVMESSGMAAYSSFGPNGTLTTGTQLPAGGQQSQLTGEAPTLQSPTPQATPDQQLPGMMAAEQVVGGYSRTERLLELMLLRGIPTLKPPRGP